MTRAHRAVKALTLAVLRVPATYLGVCTGEWIPATYLGVCSDTRARKMSAHIGRSKSPGVCTGEHVQNVYVHHTMDSYEGAVISKEYAAPIR